MQSFCFFGSPKEVGVRGLVPAIIDKNSFATSLINYFLLYNVFLSITSIKLIINNHISLLIKIFFYLKQI